MNKIVIHIIMIKILFLLIIIFLSSIYNCYESFVPGMDPLPRNYDVNSPMSTEIEYRNNDNTSNVQYINRKNRIFNNNYNSIWLKNRVALNNENINDLPSGVNDYKEDISSQTFYIHIDTFKFLLNKFNKKFTLNNQEFYKKIDKLDKFIIIKKNLGNKNTWKNNYLYNPNKLISEKMSISKFNDVNKLLKYFINNFNNLFKNNVNHSKYFKYYKSFKFYPFFIYKYKIEKILKSKNINIFEIRLCILRQNDVNMIELYMIGFIENEKYILQNLLLIGNRPTADYLIRNGLDKSSYNKYYNVHNPKLDDSITYDKANKIFNSRETYDKNSNSFSIQYQYKCFDLNKPGLIIGTNNKLDCESEVDWYGRIKDYGIWDRPCLTDEECVYYKKNKNYDNEYGKCLPSGYCQLPINSKKIGYHFEKEDVKKKCYNCDTKEWEPLTELGECCEEQKDKTKYPFLNGPDYAFVNDINTRINYDIKNKYNKEKYYIKYNNLFTNDFKYYSE